MQFLEITAAVFVGEILATALFATISTLRVRKAEQAYYAKMAAFEAAVNERTETATA
jgi:hypothetical protein